MPRQTERTPAQLERQKRVFELSTQERMTIRQIADKLCVARNTVLKDLKAEAKLRDAERKELREEEKEVQLARIDDLISRTLSLSAMPGTGALQTAAKLLEMRGKILGLDAPQQIDIGVNRVLFEVSEPQKQIEE